MKVFLISSEPYGFPEAPLLGIFQKDLKDALASAGHEIIVLSPSGRSLKRIGAIRRVGRPPAVDGVIRNRAINAFPRVRFMEQRRFVSVGLRQFDEAVRKYGRPDLVHAHNAVYAGFLAQAIASKHGLPFVLTEHSSWILKRVYRSSFKRLIDQCYKAADAVVAVSKHLKDALCDGYGVKDCTVIPNILPTEFSSAAPRDSGNHTTFINVGSLDENKNQSALIKAFARLLPAYPEARLVLIGDGPARKALGDLTRALGVEAEVIFRGQLTRDQVLRDLETSSVFVLSSLVETFGVVVIEALATGLPVIATPCGGPEGVIDPGINGLYARGTGSADIYQAMLCFMQTRSTFDPEAIANAAKRRYSPDVVASSTVALYKSVLANQGA